VFKCKLGEYGQVDWFKAWLVAQQRAKIDYDETFSPVVCFESVQDLIASKGMKLHQMDMKTAFLIEELNKEIYMSQPKGFGETILFFVLRRSTYGLKQSPRCWNTVLDTSMEFVQTKWRYFSLCVVMMGLLLLLCTSMTS